MRKCGTSIFVIIFLAVIILPVLSVRVQGAEQHYCILMKFVNNTRFKRLAPETKLSDLVMEKLVASGRFHLKETRPIDEKIGTELFDADFRAEKIVSKAEKGNYDDLFDNTQATSMSEAYQGQMVSPKITSRIGKTHGAEYLIQGTILGISRGTAVDQKTSAASTAAGMALGKWGGSWGKVAQDALRDTSKTYTGTNIKSDLRIIKAATGEVVWHKTVTSASKQDKLKVGNISVGSDQLSMNLYEMALDQAAQKIVDELIADLDKGKLAGLL